MKRSIPLKLRLTTISVCILTVMCAAFAISTIYSTNGLVQAAITTPALSVDESMSAITSEPAAAVTEALWQFRGKSVIMTVAGAANCRLDYDELDRKGDTAMFTVFEETRAEGRAEEIIETGYEFGLTEQEILNRLQNKLKISFPKAQDYLKIFGNKS